MIPLLITDATKKIIHHGLGTRNLKTEENHT